MAIDTIDTIDTIAIGDVSQALLATGGKRRWRLLLSDGLTGPVATPLLTCRGGDPGPTLLVVAGVHGDEFEGPAAIRAAFARLDARHLAGTVLALPVANPWAYDAQSRESPPGVDGKNLARVFPGDAGGSATERLAADLFALARRTLGPSDLFLDLHSGGTRYRYLPMVGYRDIDNAARGPSIEAARHFGLDRLWTIPGDPGPFNAETARAGIPTVAAEAPGQGGCRAADVAIYVDGILNLLRHRGMLRDRPAPRAGGPARSTRWVHVGRHGVFAPAVDLGDEVVAGQPLATVADPYGETVEMVRAEGAGQIWALRTFPTVRPGDIAFVVADPAHRAPGGR